MAKLIFKQNIVNDPAALVNIFANDDDYNLLVTRAPMGTDEFVVDCTDAQFTQIQLREKHATVNNSQELVLIEGQDELPTELNLAGDASLLNQFISDWEYKINKRAETDPNHPKLTHYQTFVSYLKNFDFSGITYPYRSVEKYLSENSATIIVHPLQVR